MPPILGGAASCGFYGACYVEASLAALQTRQAAIKGRYTQVGCNALTSCGPHAQRGRLKPELQTKGVPYGQS